MKNDHYEDLTLLREIPVPPMFERVMCYQGNEQFVAFFEVLVILGTFTSLITRMQRSGQWLVVARKGVGTPATASYQCASAAA